MTLTATEEKFMLGWNTYNIRSVLSHVLPVEGIAVSLGLREPANGTLLSEALMGRKETYHEVVRPGPRSYDGSYTSLDIEYRGVHCTVETSAQGDEWCATITCHSTHIGTPALCVMGALLWNRPGTAQRQGKTLRIDTPGKTIEIVAEGTLIEEPVTEVNGPYLLVSLDKPVTVATSPELLAKAPERIQAARKALSARQPVPESCREAYDAMQICLAWDTVYDPFNHRIISPVSRIWSCNAGGWVLFEWDTYFAASMAALENKELAYANARAITAEVTEEGFVPNMAQPHGFKTRDRSQNPVGAITVLDLCKRFDENVLAEELFDPLLTWNRWWPTKRDIEGYLCYGSHPYPRVTDSPWETDGVNKRYGGALESLDNSPMYDEPVFDSERHVLLLADVGLMSFYIADCKALAELGDRIGRTEESRELRERADKYTSRLQDLWCEQTGLFLNRDLTTGEFVHRLSPNHFYPLLAEAATDEQAVRMIREHLFNPEEFQGDWILPSIARNDPAYPEQEYWRGRIWAPMNYLVYLGLRNYDLPEAKQARRELAEKSEALLLKEWREHGHVHENYCADTGEGCNRESSDKFYHWGGLLGLIAVLESEM